MGWKEGEIGNKQKSGQNWTSSHFCRNARYIFFKDEKGDLHTPIADSFLNGITRQTVIEIAKSKNIGVHERKIKPEELSTFVGCFLTGTAAEITPVSQIAENKYKVCDRILDLSESYGKLVRKKKAA